MISLLTRNVILLAVQHCFDQILAYSVSPVLEPQYCFYGCNCQFHINVENPEQFKSAYFCWVEKRNESCPENDQINCDSLSVEMNLLLIKCALKHKQPPRNYFLTLCTDEGPFRAFRDVQWLDTPEMSSLEPSEFYFTPNNSITTIRIVFKTAEMAFHQPKINYYSSLRSDANELIEKINCSINSTDFSLECKLPVAFKLHENVAKSCIFFRIESHGSEIVDTQFYQNHSYICIYAVPVFYEHQHDTEYLMLRYRDWFKILSEPKIKCHNPLSENKDEQECLHIHQEAGTIRCSFSNFWSSESISCTIKILESIINIDNVTKSSNKFNQKRPLASFVLWLTLISMFLIILATFLTLFLFSKTGKVRYNMQNPGEIGFVQSSASHYTYALTNDETSFNATSKSKYSSFFSLFYPKKRQPSSRLSR